MICNRCKAVIILLATALIVSAVSCKKSFKISEQAKSSRKPIGLILEGQIEGFLMGQKISQPSGIVATENGNVCFVDKGNNRIVLLDSNLKPIRDAGGFGSADGLFNSPEYISIDNNLSFYISDVGNQRIAIFDFRLNYVDRIDLFDEDDPDKFGKPSGLVVSAHGELWVADPENSKVALFNNYHQFDRFIGGIDSYYGLFLLPADITTTTDNDIVVLDAGISRVFIFDNFGILRNDFGYDDMKQPTGIIQDIDRNFWIVDKERPGLFCFNESGDLLFSEGYRGRDTDYSFNQPTDIAILNGDRIIISDTGNDRLLVYKILYM